MRINDLLVEQQLDELGMADIGRGIEKGIGGLSKAAGYVAGIPGGIAQQFQTGKARATAGIGGTLNRGAPAAPNPAYTQALQNYQTHGTATAPGGAAAPGAAGGDPASMRKQAQDFKKQSDDLMKQADAAERSANQAKAQSNQQTQAAQPASQAEAPAGGATAAQTAPATSGATAPAAGERVEPTLDQPAAATASKAAATPPATPAPAKAAPAPTPNYGRQQTGYGKQTTNVPMGVPGTLPQSAAKATQAAAAKPAVPGAAALLQPKPSFAPKVAAPSINLKGLPIKNMEESTKIQFHSKFLGRDL